jgi:O-antigen biosynthesis protein
MILPRTLTADGLDFARRQKTAGKRIIWALDDNLWACPEWNPYKGDPAILDQTLDLADIVNVSTEPLLQIVGSKGRMCPNLIDAAAYRGIVPAPHDRVRVVWAGSPTHSGDLATLADVLPRLARRFPTVEWHFFGWMPSFMEGIGIYHPPCDFNDFPRALISLGGDIGLAPLADVEFNQSKSNIRWLEYTLAGMVTVASGVGPYQCIDNGIGSVLAWNTEEWEKYLAELIEDRDTRIRMWSAARDRVLREFSWQSETARFPWLEFFCTCSK